MHNKKYFKRWHRRAMLFDQSVPSYVMPWLFDTSSLTKRLIQCCPKKFRVKVIVQSVIRPTLDERITLGIGFGKFVGEIMEELQFYAENGTPHPRKIKAMEKRG